MDVEFDSVLGTAPGGEPIGVVVLQTAQLRVGLCNYGARMLSIEAPDRSGRFDHVLLGFDQAATVLKAGSFGAVIGRYANRIAHGRFTLDGTVYQLSVNDGENTLHGGKVAIAKCFWRVAERSPAHVAFSLDSPDGDQGFPGALAIRATYRLQENQLSLTLQATTTRPTPVNLSAHPYFNLAGAAALDVCDHTMQIAASHFLPTNDQQIPTGEIRAVAGTPFDFRAPVMIGSRIRDVDEQLLFARGFDHHFILDDPSIPGRSASDDGSGPNASTGPRFKAAVRMVHPASGRLLEIATTQPGVQVYTGNSLNGSLVGHGGTYRQTAGVAFEPQAYPDAPNQPHFPSTILRPGTPYEARIDYRFSTAER